MPWNWTLATLHLYNHGVQSSGPSFCRKGASICASVHTVETPATQCFKELIQNEKQKLQLKKKHHIIILKQFYCHKLPNILKQNFP